MRKLSNTKDNWVLELYSLHRNRALKFISAFERQVAVASSNSA